MPLYTFLNTESDLTEDHWVTMADYDQFLLDNPNLQREWSGGSLGSIGDPIKLGITKTPEAFRDVLRTIKKKHRNALSGGTNISVCR